MFKHLMVVLALAVVASNAAGQTASRWIEPGGHFSLSYDALGWSPVAGASNANGQLLEIEQRQLQEGGRMRTCFVTERSGPVPPTVDQQGLNRYAASQTAQNIETRIGLTPIRVDHTDVDGVTVTDATFDQPNYQRMRIFYLKDHDRMLQFLVNCGAALPITADVTNNIDALLATLRIGSMGAAQ